MKKLFILLLFPLVSLAQNDSIVVVKPKFSVIGLDKMNVVYRGVPNPISIAVNDAKSFKITGDGVSQNEDGKYVINPNSGTETKVFVEIEKNDGSIIAEEHSFLIKPISLPTLTLNGEFSKSKYTPIFNINEIKNAELELFFKDMPFASGKIKQFNLKVPRYPTIVIQENRINDEAFQIIKKARKKDILIISEIKTEFVNIQYACYRTSPFIFKIIK